MSLPSAFPIRPLLPILLAALSGHAAALGLGEVRGQSYLGEPLSVDVEIAANNKEVLDSSCFRLVPLPAADGLPRVAKARLSYRKGQPGLLEIRGHEPIREPAFQLTVAIACGHEVRRDYVFLASPRLAGNGAATVAASEQAKAEGGSARATPVPTDRETRFSGAGKSRSGESELRRGMSRRTLSGVAGESVLSSSQSLAAWQENSDPSLDARREVLRLEFRMLTALYDQALTQLDAAARLRNMESHLGELQKRVGEFGQRAEGKLASAAGSEPAVEEKPGEAPPPAIADQGATSVRSAEIPAAASAAVLPQIPDDDGFWGIIGALLGGLVGVGGYFGWRYWKRRKEEAWSESITDEAPDMVVDPKRSEEREEPGGVDLAVEPAAMGMPMHVDVPLDGPVEHSVMPDLPPARPVILPPSPAPAPPSVGGPQFSIAATSIDEQFEASPVMELAEIMLSFGRVRGAAQALQEFIDQNPEEALQPWLRLLDVYRMAGMRDEFDKLAVELNKVFNVEIQQWENPSPEPATVLEESVSLPDEGPLLDDENMLVMDVPRTQTLEDMPRICNQIAVMWNEPDCEEYLHQLLRDNRGGTRAGFPLTVVEEILMLIGVKEVLGKMARENK